MTTLYEISTNQKKTETERKVADMMYNGFCWDYIVKCLGDVESILYDITMQIDAGASIQR